MMHDPGASKCAVLCRASLRTSLVHTLSPHAPCRALCRGGGRGGCQRLTWLLVQAWVWRWTLGWRPTESSTSMSACDTIQVMYCMYCWRRGSDDYYDKLSSLISDESQTWVGDDCGW